MAFWGFFTEQIFPPFLGGVGLGLWILLLSVLYPRLRLWVPAGRTFLFAFSLLPLVGFVPASVLALRLDDKAGLWAAGIATFFSLVVAVSGAMSVLPPVSLGADLKVFAGLIISTYLIVVFYSVVTDIQ